MKKKDKIVPLNNNQKMFCMARLLWYVDK